MPSELTFFSCGHHRLTPDDTTAGEQIKKGNPRIAHHTISRLPCESCSRKDLPNEGDSGDPYLLSLPHLSSIFIAHGYGLSSRYAAATAAPRTPEHEEARQHMADAVQSFADLTEQYLSGRSPKPPLEMMMSVICSALDILESFASVVAGLEKPKELQDPAGSPGSAEKEKSRLASEAPTSSEGSASVKMTPASSVSATGPGHKADLGISTKLNAEAPDFVVHNRVKYPRAPIDVRPDLGPSVAAPLYRDPSLFGRYPSPYTANFASPDPDSSWVPVVFDRPTPRNTSTPPEKDWDSDPASIQQHIDLITSIHELLDSSTADNGGAGLKDQKEPALPTKISAAVLRNAWPCAFCGVECFCGGDGTW
ncbi:uncharacterized protein BDZ99DRAFT_232356 [Mytilinidion resinicola]|uniref:Uncharacterized protein n=1 Tax=Mytilinidion resinicola TaxID=574789 RepID=A0A6A6Z0D9_9PEZI|nr:uncharacterized protein BDZ99DRAFT_232356 [Mytilinidion resinicola]KAF2814163.1 hypothetical protein BDZ99DRAFT_232356 [Mytilinidion resinicola]